MKTASRILSASIVICSKFFVSFDDVLVFPLIFILSLRRLFLMRRFSILFIVLGLISFSASSTHAQSREIGAQSLALDDNHGHVVDITIPLMTGPGPYSWVLPITPGGSALSLPFGTINNSTLFWSGTQ